MANDWFQFKQFRVSQDLCAMKVSTDACIQGAWAAQRLYQLPVAAPRVLDIGTGTGLLTLMLAQAVPSGSYDAIEINGQAYRQAVANFGQSRWKNALRTFHASLSVFTEAAINHGIYHFIICNPPFFHKHLESQAKARNDARHSQSLGKPELATAIAQLLAPSGKSCVLFPASEWGHWLEQAAAQGLYPDEVLYVRPKPGHAANRVIGIFSKEAKRPPSTSELVIYKTEKQYTPQMRSLLQDYYLAF